MIQRFAIITDRTSPVSSQMAHALGIEVIPFHVRIGERWFTVESELDIPDFYELLSQSQSYATEAPTIEECREVLVRAQEAHDEVLVLCASRNISATYDRARAAVVHLPGKIVTVVDAGSAQSAQGLLLTAAAACRDRGLTLDATVSAVRELTTSMETIALVETFAYLERSPGFARASQLFGSIRLAHPARGPVEDPMVGSGVSLMVRPDATSFAGQLRGLAEARLDPTRRLHLWVLHTNLPTAAEELLTWFRSRFDCVESFASDAGPVIAVHTGPGLLGVSWYQESVESRGTLPADG